MKVIATIIFLFFCVNPLFAQPSQFDTLRVKTMIYCDHCTDCEDCMPHIERELRFTKGVESSSVNVADQTITIIYHPGKTNPAKLKKAISKAGFDADEIKADPKAQAALDDCCRKK